MYDRRDIWVKQGSVKWGWRAHRTLTVRDICSFALLFSVFKWIYERSYIWSTEKDMKTWSWFELRVLQMKSMYDHRSCNSNLSNCKFFRAKICSCLNCNYNCDDHISMLYEDMVDHRSFARNLPAVVKFSPPPPEKFTTAFKVVWATTTINRALDPAFFVILLIPWLYRTS